uniref:Uncharacterized protein n=1 Tax=Acrobeloides nanus TaxID=290746 RepID=A0A914CGM6_9BILA
MVLCSYQNQIYEALGDVEQTAKMVDKDQINEIGKIILDHEYEEDVCVIIAHRHFNLAQDEAMLETLEGKSRVSRPVSWENIASMGAFPNVITCTRENQWYPVGYGTRTSETRPCSEKEFTEGIPTTYSFARGKNGQVEQGCNRGCRPTQAGHVIVHIG